MEHLRIFETENGFETLKENLAEPWVTLTEDDGKVHYMGVPVINQDDLTDGDYVDLGLPSGTLWATCNLGASIPCEYGLFYQWGATEGYEGADAKAHSNWNTAPWPSNVEPDILLDNEHDAVYQATNGVAKMPTDADINELIKNTTSTWCKCTVLGDDHTEHNVSGRLITSKTDESKKIFIPAAGQYASGNYSQGGTSGSIWASTLNPKSLTYGYYMYISSSSPILANTTRCYAFNIRGVIKNED